MTLIDPPVSSWSSVIRYLFVLGTAVVVLKSVRLANRVPPNATSG